VLPTRRDGDLFNFVAVIRRLRNEFVLAYRDRQLCQCPANLSAEMFAQQQTERPLSCAAGLSHGRKENLRAFDRAVSARAVNLPAPGLWRRALVLHDNGKIGMIDHWLFNLTDWLNVESKAPLTLSAQVTAATSRYRRTKLDCLPCCPIAFAVACRSRAHRRCGQSRQSDAPMVRVRGPRVRRPGARVAFPHRRIDRDRSL
jgi:hypothetical protein